MHLVWVLFTLLSGFLYQGDMRGMVYENIGIGSGGKENRGGDE